MRCLSFSLATLTLLCGAPVFAQEPRLDTIPVASIDFYGLHQAPTGSVRLPAPVTAAGQEFERAFADAIDHKDFAESDTAGYALMHWPGAQAVQLRFVPLAARYEGERGDRKAILEHQPSVEPIVR